MSSKIRVGLSKTGLVSFYSYSPMFFQVLLQFYYCRIFASYLGCSSTCEKSFEHEKMAFYMGAEMEWVWFGMHYFKTVNVC